MHKDDIVTVNVTFKTKAHRVVEFENYFNHKGGAVEKLIDYKILPNTDYLRENDKAFQKLLKKKKDASAELDEYINLKNK